MSDVRAAAMALYDRFTHEGLDRRAFMAELTRLAGSAAAASVLLGGGAVVLVAARSLPVVAVYLAVALVGIGYAGAQMFPMAMLPDVAAVDAARTGENRIGVFTGVWTAGETLGLALGPGVYAVVLALGGYVSSTNSAAAQPDSAVTAIAVGFSVVPAALVALSLLLLARYGLDESAVEASAASVAAQEEV